MPQEREDVKPQAPLDNFLPMSIIVEQPGRGRALRRGETNRGALCERRWWQWELAHGHDRHGRGRDLGTAETLDRPV